MFADEVDRLSFSVVVAKRRSLAAISENGSIEDGKRDLRSVLRPRPRTFMESVGVLLSFQLLDVGREGIK